MITERIKALLKKHKKTQLELAVGLGMGETTVSYNIRHPSIDFVRTACGWLDEPFARAVLSDEEIALLTSPDPVVLRTVVHYLPVCFIRGHDRFKRFFVVLNEVTFALLQETILVRYLRDGIKFFCMFFYFKSHCTTSLYAL